MLDKIRWKMQDFMRGRNGVDDLARVVIYANLIIYIISLVTKIQVLYIISLVGWIYGLFRMLSRNIGARSEENRKFLNFFSFQKTKYDQRKTYKIFTCKSCGKHLRVPKGKGKVEVTCPVCGTKKIHRT